MKLAEEKLNFLFILCKIFKKASKLQKCDFADYILHIFMHFLDIFENFALNMKKSNFSSANFIFYGLLLKNPH